LVAIFRAVLVWAVVLCSVVVARTHSPVGADAAPVVTQPNAYHGQSVLGSVKQQHQVASQGALVDVWTNEYDSTWTRYQLRLQAQADAMAEAQRISALNNHAPPPAYIAQIIHNAFSPLGPRAVQWAVNVAYCESRYHPNSVNSDSGASGLFQFLPSTWAFTPEHAQSPFDPTANANAAAWLYQRDGPSQWQCQG
jgi:hypothetical protein